MIGRLRDSNSGKYVNNPDKGVLISVRIDKNDFESLKKILDGDETMSDKVREAIACYLNEQKALDLLEDIIYDAVAAEESLPPHEEYIVSGELIREATSLLHEDTKNPR